MAPSVRNTARETGCDPPAEIADQTVVVGPALVIQLTNLAEAGIRSCGRQRLEAGRRVGICKIGLIDLLVTAIADIIRGENQVLAEPLLQLEVPLVVLGIVQFVGDGVDVGPAETNYLLLQLGERGAATKAILKGCIRVSDSGEYTARIVKRHQAVLRGEGCNIRCLMKLRRALTPNLMVW